MHSEKNLGERSPAPIAPEVPDLPLAVTEPGVLAIARGLDEAQLHDAVPSLLSAGVRAIEVTLDSPAALSSITSLRDLVGTAGVLGAGTVRRLDEARRAVTAGAEFLVAPSVDAEVIAWCASHGVPILPGAFTPTEIDAARRAGASAVKWFPAAIGGPLGFSALRGPFAGLPLVPTGGVTIEDVGAYIRAGAAAVAVGNWIFGAGESDRVSDRCEQLLTEVAAGRQAL